MNPVNESVRYFCLLYLFQVTYRLNKRPHSVVRLKMSIKRKYFFYMMNLVLPCALIACMIFLVFLLPPKSGERISLGITVLLSMAIFQELSSEKLPNSSDNFPLLGKSPMLLLLAYSFCNLVGSMEAPSKIFLLFLLLPDWLKLNHLKSRIDCFLTFFRAIFVWP